MLSNAGHLLCERWYEFIQHYLKSGVSRFGPNVTTAAIFPQISFPSVKTIVCKPPHLSIGICISNILSLLSLAYVYIQIRLFFSSAINNSCNITNSKSRKFRALFCADSFWNILVQFHWNVRTLINIQMWPAGITLHRVMNWDQLPKTTWLPADTKTQDMPWIYMKMMWVVKQWKQQHYSNAFIKTEVKTREWALVTHTTNTVLEIQCLRNDTS
jgi:hypothetical protein